jgi:hypothetical protein
MKGKILLVFLTISGLLITAHSVSATTNEKATNLSRTITDLVKLDANYQSLVERAIDRALVVKEINIANENGHLAFQIRQIPRGRIIKIEQININPGHIGKIKKLNTNLEHIVKKESEEPKIIENGGVVEGGDGRDNVPASIPQTNPSVIGQISR